MPDTYDGPFRCDIRANFAKAFGTWRRKNHIPLKQVAADLGIAVSTVNSWELGLRFPTGEHFQALADYTGLPPCRLFCIMADICVPAECQLALRNATAPPSSGPESPL
jgi:transcriptional regulator with XRE-family HTH domain